MTTDRFHYVGPRNLLPAITRALQQIVDPEIAMNIVDVGLVREVLVRPGRIDAVITLTSAACPAADLVVEDVREALGGVLPEAQVGVELAWEPPWTPQRMSDRALRIMGC